ncbi:NAD(P)H-binding protein [Rhizobium puerariae]|uniref:NAD(P)H-binding protein n=1 Tax=Rhizobium puerariae TaxID=1585791 RepID=A0ABV6ADU1_9HYPH
MIVVTGGNGKLGRAIVNSLRSRGLSGALAVSVRDAGQAGELEAMGMKVHQADYENPESLRHAFQGADQILMVSSNASAHGADPLVQHRNVIAAAKEAGVGRVVYTSHMAASAASAFPPMHTHHATELMLRESGLAWTALRDGFYAGSIVAMVREGIRGGRIMFPEDGKVSWTAHADLADAAAAILMQPGRFEGPTPPLTAGEALDLEDIARIASTVVGHPVRREYISDEDMAKRLTSRGLSAVVVEITLGMFRASRNGEFAKVDPTLAQLLGRPTTSLADLLAGDLAPAGGSGS